MNHNSGRLIVLLCLCGGTALTAVHAASAPASRTQIQTLPAFAELIERQGAIVVNISATRATNRLRTPFLHFNEQDERVLPDWLRRFAPKRGPREEAPDEEDEDRSLGSGFIISEDGYVLTNAHVVEDADEILVRLSDKREFTGRLVGSDKRTDIALLKLEAKGLPRAVAGDPARLRVGDWVVAIGSPFGFDSSVTAGIVSAKARSLPDETLVPFIQTDVAINPGNSGGPLFNLRGEVVGINSQIYSRSGGFMGISFAIPIDVAMDVQAQLRQYGRVARGRVGVVIQDVSKQMADSFALARPAGALVSGIDPGGPADKAGIKVGDIILRFDGKSVASSLDLPRIVGATRPGVRVVMDVWRAGAPRALPVQVGEFPQEEARRPPAQSLVLPKGANQIGLVTEDLSRERRRELKISGGAAIREARGVAARAELRPGDVITSLIVKGASHDVRSSADFNRQVNGLGKGSALALLVRRGDAQSFVGMQVPNGK